MNRNTIILIIAMIYVLSPLDLAPGIIFDDVVALAIALTPFFKKKTEA